MESIVQVNSQLSRTAPCQETINSFSQNMLARDSVALRNYIQSISPDIDLTSEIEIGGETVSVSIPLTVGFFWPNS